MCCLGLENKVRKEGAEDATTMAAQGWLPIKFPGRTKTTSVLGLVTLCGVITRPFAMIHDVTVLLLLLKCKRGHNHAQLEMPI
jgi:hypothetical protein